MVIDQDIDNGKLLVKGEYVTPELYQGLVPTKKDKVFLVLNPPTIAENYTSAMQDPKYFYNAASDSAKKYYNGLRCYPLNENDVFTVSAIGIKAAATDVVVNGANYIVADGIDLKEVTADPKTTNGFVGKVIEKVTKSNGVSYRIEVIQNVKLA